MSNQDQETGEAYKPVTIADLEATYARAYLPPVVKVEIGSLSILNRWRREETWVDILNPITRLVGIPVVVSDTLAPDEVRLVDKDGRVLMAVRGTGRVPPCPTDPDVG